ncbi:Signal peptide peptidase family protein, expressed isoform 1 [Dorcoceras hygrometricum]|uniref:Signal peptide peptidase family protein, expressed isoform 1 n=1 Tax=Dorcoceras hygrometricum TaxID=472368 RepID=A0A2Z7AER0_9LAMI|nr:Signal peptide peptidase family protein, expressed isoform 1 [Dorcoceras hygrometricum]
MVLNFKRTRNCGPMDFGALQSWCISWMLEKHEDKAQSVKSSSRAESRAEKKCRFEEQNAKVQNSSNADQVQCTRVVIECEAVYKSNISTGWLVISSEWSKAGASKHLEEQERTEQAQLQTKRGTDAEVAPDDQFEDKNKEAGEEKERALQELMN